MESQPVIVEVVIDAPADKAWEALTDNDQLKKWYFVLPEFFAEVGFEFRFTGGKNPDKPFFHTCRVTEVVNEQILAYTWKYEGFEGVSLVEFELFEDKRKTLVRVTHSGIETFKPYLPDLDKKEFLVGWTGILNSNLKEYLENK
jgi:uncharacterized protein YndB with AHSA1/START domain